MNTEEKDLLANAKSIARTNQPLKWNERSFITKLAKETGATPKTVSIAVHGYFDEITDVRYRIRLKALRYHGATL